MSLSLIEKKEMRKFGGIAFIFFGVLCALGFWRQKTIPFYLFGLLSSLGIGFILLPSILKPVYDGWLKAAHFIGRTITTLILAMAYYLVITPTAFIKRIFGGLPIPIRPDRKAQTYWVTRSEPAQPVERFIKRY